MTDRFIVAEVSKTWVRGMPVTGTPLISQSFEQIINTNHRRGYHLYFFSLNRLVVSEEEINETIIAVFERTT
jgi:hypothetical protein